jgi:hypothetical protein
MRIANRLASVGFMLVLALILVAASALKGQDAGTASPSVVPPLIKFNGIMTAPGTQNRTSGDASTRLVTATFSLYTFQEGGTPLWSETQKVQVDEQNRYVVLLGAASSAGVPVDLFASGKALWLGVQPQLSGAGELPRVLLAPVPYALKASDSDTLGGKPASAFALAGAPTVAVMAGGAALPSASTNPASPSTHEDATTAKAAAVQPLTACSAVTSDGTAAANTVAKFTAACNVGKSLISDNGVGVAVGGTATPGALFGVQFSSTATSGVLYGQRVYATLNPAAASSAGTFGIQSTVQTQTGNTQNFNNGIDASSFFVSHSGTGTLSNAVGMNSGVQNLGAGTMSNTYGISSGVFNRSTGKITNGYGVYVDAPANSGGGIFQNYTGLYIASPTAVTGAYGLYSAGGKNYFAGNVGIATTTPGANLEVNGTAKFDGLVTFKSGQTFPIPAAGVTDAMLANPYSGIGTCATGKVVSALTRNAAPTCLTMSTGTVTSVASGSGLTGGPITGSGTLSIPTAGVTDAMLASSYSGTGTCAVGQVVTGLTRNGAPTCATANIGTITGVSPGAGLLGGGTSGPVTLSLDTSKVPTLGASTNTFTGSITASLFSGVGSGLTSVNAATLGGVTSSAFQPAGSYATLGANTFAAGQTISSGDLYLPQTTGASTGVINLGGIPFIHACCSNTQYNTFVGSNAGNFTATGVDNTASGFFALHSNITGDGNTASGFFALYANTSGNFNTASGNEALLYNTTGNGNTASGNAALDNNTTGGGNTASGSNALINNTTANGNTASGSSALESNCLNIVGDCAGNYNTAVGFNAGVTANSNNANVTGANNTFIGYDSGPGTSTQLNYATAIGAGALVSASNALVLGGTGTYAVKVGIGTSTPSDALDINNTIGTNILVGQQNGANKFRVDATGKGYFDGGTATSGADFAESVAVRGNRSAYEPGDLLVIDPSGERRLALAETPYSTLVAGIYSTKPGVLATPHTMDDPRPNTSEVPLAVVGIVPCKVTAENGSIAVGDLLVTSSRAGYAMKGTERSRMLGAVVGKALEPLPQGTGVIQVLVTLQ